MENYIDTINQEHPGVHAMLEVVASMKAPSIAEILKKRGFKFEARVMEKLVEEWNIGLMRVHKN